VTEEFPLKILSEITLSEMMEINQKINVKNGEQALT